MCATTLDTGVLVELLGKQTMSFLLKVIETVTVGGATDHLKIKTSFRVHRTSKLRGLV